MIHTSGRTKYFVPINQRESEGACQFIQYPGYRNFFTYHFLVNWFSALENQEFFLLHVQSGFLDSFDSSVQF